MMRESFFLRFAQPFGERAGEKIRSASGAKH
jgi:hypothetical protein